jgi:hypothetical protein
MIDFGNLQLIRQVKKNFFLANVKNMNIGKKNFFLANVKKYEYSVFGNYLRGASPRRHLRSFRQDSLQSGHPSDQLFTVQLNYVPLIFIRIRSAITIGAGCIGAP